nr:MAG TPA: hypothetical protein [Caudoviricetes sp.]
MKINIQFTNKEVSLLAKVMKKYDFMDRINHEKLSLKYREGNSAGHFSYSGISDKGANIEFESHEKLMVAACNVYLKYADTVNGILAGVKSVVMSCKALFRNFESDYKVELNKAFDEIEVEAKMKKEAEKAEKKIREEIREKAEADLIKRKFDRIKSIEKETEDDDDALY